LHTYTTAGTYTVSLEVVNISGYNTTTKTDYITVAEWVPVASFNRSHTAAYTGQTVFTNDTSTNEPITWQWSFGDLTANITTENATHAYTAAGNYTIGLTVTNAAGQSSTNHYIDVYDNVTADFTATASGNTVTFTDLSLGTPTSWVWQYNQHEAPGWVEFSTSQNPPYNFPEGTFDINLTATNAISSDSETKVSFVIVSGDGTGTVLTDDPPTPYDVAHARYATSNDGMITAMILIFLVAAIVGVAIAIKCIREGVSDATIPLIVGYFIGVFILVILFATIPAFAHIGEVI
jgi:PKD repeat protein